MSSAHNFTSHNTTQHLSTGNDHTDSDGVRTHCSTPNYEKKNRGARKIEFSLPTRNCAVFRTMSYLPCGTKPLNHYFFIHRWEHSATRYPEQKMSFIFRCHANESGEKYQRKRFSLHRNPRKARFRCNLAAAKENVALARRWARFSTSPISPLEAGRIGTSSLFPAISFVIICS